jgi:hypothetical protein
MIKTGERTAIMNSYQGQTDHDIDQEGLRDTQEEAERETAGWSSRSDLGSLPDDQIEAGSPLGQMLLAAYAEVTPGTDVSRHPLSNYP